MPHLVFKALFGPVTIKDMQTPPTLRSGQKNCAVKLCGQIQNNLDEKKIVIKKKKIEEVLEIFSKIMRKNNFKFFFRSIYKKIGYVSDDFKKK